MPKISAMYLIKFWKILNFPVEARRRWERCSWGWMLFCWSLRVFSILSDSWGWGSRAVWGDLMPPLEGKSCSLGAVGTAGFGAGREQWEVVEAQPGPETQEATWVKMGWAPVLLLLQTLGSFLEAGLQGEKILAKGKPKGAFTSRTAIIIFVMCWDHQPEVSSPVLKLFYPSSALPCWVISGHLQTHKWSARY